MLIIGATQYDLCAAVEAADDTGNLILNRSDRDGFTRDRRPKFLVTLRVQDCHGRYARRGYRGKRLVAACYHGYRAFMRELFARVPHASIHSMYANFAGAEDFTRHHWKVGEHNIGSQAFPLPYARACDCQVGG